MTNSTPATPCDCSHEFGPCEDHGTTILIREGASLRTADELAMTFLDDMRSLPGVGLTRDALGVLREAEAELETTGDRWLTEELADAVREAGEAISPPDDIMIVWNDGYVVSSLAPTCPLLA